LAGELMRRLGAALAVIALAGAAEAAAPMLTGLEGWTVTPLFTVGEEIDAVTPPGILDGIGAFAYDDVVLVLVNHELRPDAGRPYHLANGVEITGARVTAFDIDRATRRIVGAGLAYDTVYDRGQAVVTAASQISEIAGALGFSRFCSGQGIAKGAYGLADDVFLVGEETLVPRHPFGGSIWALDVRRGELWAAPAMGRGAWENATALETGDPDTVAFLLGDDSADAPLYLYVGDKGKIFGNRIIPESLRQEYESPEPTIESSPGHYQEWINACKGGQPAGSNFDWAGPLTEVVLMGNVPLRMELREKLDHQKLLWDAEAKRFSNLPEANEFLHKTYRAGWTLNG